MDLTHTIAGEFPTLLLAVENAGSRCWNASIPTAVRPS